MRLKEQLSDAQRFVHYSLTAVCTICHWKGGVHFCASVKPQQFLHFEENLLYVSFYIRSNIQENVDLIKLQRDMKEKATKFEALQVKYLNLEEVR